MEPTRYFVNNNDVQSYSLKELLEHLEPGMLIRRDNSESWEKWEDVRIIKYLSSLTPFNRNWFVVLTKLFLGIVIYFCVTLEIYPAYVASYYDHFCWYIVILHLVLPITAAQIFVPKTLHLLALCGQLFCNDMVELIYLGISFILFLFFPLASLLFFPLNFTDFVVQQIGPHGMNDLSRGQYVSPSIAISILYWGTVGFVVIIQLSFFYLRYRRGNLANRYPFIF